MIHSQRGTVEATMDNALRWIWVTFQKAAIHRYPDAATSPLLADVRYLASPHRHLMKFRVYIEIYHNDRDIEFIQFLNFCESLFGDGAIDIDNKSVEMLADDMYVKIAAKYPNRKMKIEVSEDGENGCLIEYL